MVASVDENMGRLLRALDEAGIADDTLVIFTSDNGGLEGNAPLRGKKGELWEGGTRVPLIVRKPGLVAAGSTCDEPVISYDFFPTLLDVAGSGEAQPAGVEGVSLLPLLKGDGGFVRTEPLYWHYPHFHHDGGPMGSSIRAGEWKLIFPYETGTPLLFDLAADPSEQNNVAAGYPEKTAQLKARLFRQLKAVNAAMPARRGP
jgi:arylsulfatase A